MSGTCVVACKLPMGLALRIFNMIEVDEPGLGGTVHKVKKAVHQFKLPNGQPIPGMSKDGYVHINGTSHHQNEAPKSPIVGGYAITPGIDKDFMDVWMEQNALNDLVVNRLIFTSSQAKNGDVSAMCRDLKDVKSGFERMEPDNLPREARGGMNPNVSSIQTGKKDPT